MSIAKSFIQPPPLAIVFAIVFTLNAPADTLKATVQKQEQSQAHQPNQAQSPSEKVLLDQSQTTIPAPAPDVLGRTKTRLTLPRFDGKSETPLTQIPAVDTSSKPIPVLEVGTKPQSNGVLGVFIGQYDGTVTQIFPGSDSNGKLKIGDKVVAVDGRHYGSVFETQRAFIGVPGSVVQVTIVRSGKETTFSITRTDWRIYENQGLPYQYASPANAGIVRH